MRWRTERPRRPRGRPASVPRFGDGDGRRCASCVVGARRRGAVLESCGVVAPPPAPVGCRRDTRYFGLSALSWFNGTGPRNSMPGLTGSASTTTFPGLVRPNAVEDGGVEERVGDPVKAGPRLEFVMSGNGPHLARNAAFSGSLYQAAIWLYISSNFGAEGSCPRGRPLRRH